jgi:hypothetical protein
MLTLKKINDKNKSSKCNYEFLVYEHSHSDIMDCDYLGEKLSRARNIVPDSWDNKEIKWNVSNSPALKINGLRFNCWEKIVMILAAEASSIDYRMATAIEVKFYLIDKEGKKITKHPILT